MIAEEKVWTVIVLLAIGTFLIRFSFLGLVGDKELPPIVLKALRYTPVAVLPGMVAPLVLWPAATQGMIDPLRLFAACVTLGVGMWRKSFMPAAISGAVAFYGGLWVLSLAS
ncbi:AzlD domain-containing protein [Marivivens sp. LCG002]|uniref:AzlD domain-containing protein n=1 Tax=Marivivens sp. LCG002 TaxID=3051171 RepID=UPI00255316BC|nr:AzlD domain-containing protein [Marivivens sp. LCG002]WIV50563.1 AzlD domain-containing protein [Marivivens sp. LCG002]